MSAYKIFQKIKNTNGNHDISNLLPCNIPDKELTELVLEFYGIIPYFGRQGDSFKLMNKLIYSATNISSIVCAIRAKIAGDEPESEEGQDDSREFIECFINYSMNMMLENTGRRSDLLSHDSASIDNILKAKRPSTIHIKSVFDSREEIKGFLKMIGQDEIIALKQ